MSQDSRTYLFGAFVSTRRIAPCTRPMRIPICCNRRNEGVPRYIEGENALPAIQTWRGFKSRPEDGSAATVVVIELLFLRSLEVPRDQPAVAPRSDPLHPSLAHDGHDRLDGSVSRQPSADADQHPRRVQLTARMSRDVRGVGSAEATRIEADFTGTQRDPATAVRPRRGRRNARVISLQAKVVRLTSSVLATHKTLLQFD